MNSKKSDLAKPLSQSIPELFRQALEAQQANHFIQSETIYRQILAVSPNHSDSLYNIGLIALQMGRMDVAATMLLKAATLAPSADVYSLLGLALMNNNQESQFHPIKKRLLSIQMSIWLMTILAFYCANKIATKKD